MKTPGGALLCGLLFCGVLPVCAYDGANNFVSDTVVLNASPPQVWEAIKAARLGDPGHRRIVSASGPDYVTEETFNKIPMLGNVVCRYSEHEVADNKLEYKMISSDKFVVFKGQWELCPVGAGKQTSLTLTSFVDTGLRLPFADKITRDSTKKSVESRLDQVKDVLAKGK